MQLEQGQVATISCQSEDTTMLKWQTFNVGSFYYATINPSSTALDNVFLY